ncbi:MAG: hypothetical protein MK189_04560 [Acidimicrobiales bacterium]|nr:hypothetical protein [Acidimicrobiales bacterium]
MNEQLVLTSNRNHRPTRPRFLLDARTRVIGLAGVARARAELRRHDPVADEPPAGAAPIADEGPDDDPDPQRRAA